MSVRMPSEHLQRNEERGSAMKTDPCPDHQRAVAMADVLFNVNIDKSFSWAPLHLLSGVIGGPE